MGVEFVGGKVSIAANGTGSISLRYDRDANIIQFLINSTGRCEIQEIELQGVERYLTGVIEVDQLKMHGNVYPLPEPIKYPRGTLLTISLADISGATNLVYFGVVMKY